MEDKIIKLLTDRKCALTVHEINDALGYSSLDDFKELVKTLNEMEDNLRIYHTNKDKFMLFEDSHLRVGKLVVNKKGYGFVDIIGDEDVYVASDNMNGALHGDTVVVEITSKKGFDLEGRIVKIVKRDLNNLVGVVYFKKGVKYVDLDDKKIKINVRIDDKDFNTVAGHKVLVKLLRKISDTEYKGEVIRVLGHINDPLVDVLSIIARYGINDIFSKEVMEEVRKIPDHVLDDEYSGRLDLTKQVIFTIDGDDTKDIDDAISIEKLDNGHYKLGVHIADVAHYVKENGELDKEAYDRGTSVYLADMVVPMLPHELSNGICSLNPNVDRLTVSCIMEIDDKGEVVDYSINESVINSKIQMTYKKVNQILEENVIPEGYEPYVKDLRLMKELADILRKNKISKGYIDFDIDEGKIIVDEKGEAIDVVLRERGVGEKLIEDFMIAANECVARHIYYMDYPFIYRVHGEPNEEKMRSFLSFISLLGYKVDADINKLTPKMVQSILNQLRDKKEFEIISSQMLRSMQKAIYDPVNIGHFGLGSKCYTHFTSPIRRYPDQTVHRLLKKYLFSNDITGDTIRYWENRLPALAEHSSMKERASIDCEREVDEMKKAEYMEKHIGETYTGIISGVMSFGVFVELPNTVEGLVRIEDLPEDFYTYDESTFSLIGNKNKRGYRLGDEVKVVVKSASKINHTVDFILEK